MNHFILRLLVLICLVCVPSRGKLNKIRVREVSGRGDLAQNLPVPVESVVFGGDAHATMTTQPTEFLSTFDNKRVSVPTMNDVDNYLILTANGLMHVLDKSLNHLSSHDTGGLLLNSWQQENDPNLSILPAADGTVIVQENEGLSYLTSPLLAFALFVVDYFPPVPFFRYAKNVSFDQAEGFSYPCQWRGKSAGSTCNR